VREADPQAAASTPSRKPASRGSRYSDRIFLPPPPRAPPRPPPPLRHGNARMVLKKRAPELGG